MTVFRELCEKFWEEPISMGFPDVPSWSSEEDVAGAVELSGIAKTTANNKSVPDSINLGAELA